ncbi:MAG TPA: type II toxin-antitoxin system HicB family antitoxin [Alphaproteobacteria bacterium]|nr:type II toxin-antitoxin system HicB family antitoxin [Alphaproteobacteria bacterium]
MRYQVLLFRGEDGWIVAECPSLPGCVSQGRTREEALANIKEAMELWLEVEAEESGAAPEPRTIELAEIEVRAG